MRRSQLCDAVDERKQDLVESREADLGFELDAGGPKYANTIRQGEFVCCIEKHCLPNTWVTGKQ
jgi:hypothetical protein